MFFFQCPARLPLVFLITALDSGKKRSPGKCGAEARKNDGALFIVEPQQSNARRARSKAKPEIEVNPRAARLPPLLGCTPIPQG
jgi:hypothetical protein